MCASSPVPYERCRSWPVADARSNEPTYESSLRLAERIRRPAAGAGGAARPPLRWPALPSKAGADPRRPAARCRTDHQSPRLPGPLRRCARSRGHSSARQLKTHFGPLSREAAAKVAADSRSAAACADRLARTLRTLHGARFARRESAALAGLAAAKA